ncbi:hypothetical protein ACQP00_12405 [Dactylosporangium sp. CS-047395]|uniref:hypothetical protein n=1 Tax=Dactylosporangium sp. CS-047395 TaxID=3239936 RepID=UPI003D93955F
MIIVLLYVFVAIMASFTVAPLAAITADAEFKVGMGITAATGIAWCCLVAIRR